MSYIEALKNVKKVSSRQQQQSQMVLNLTPVLKDFNVFVMGFEVFKQAGKRYRTLTIKSLDHYTYLYMERSAYGQYVVQKYSNTCLHETARVYNSCNHNHADGDQLTPALKNVKKVSSRQQQQSQMVRST